MEATELNTYNRYVRAITKRNIEEQIDSREVGVFMIKGLGYVICKKEHLELLGLKCEERQ